MLTFLIILPCLHCHRIFTLFLKHNVYALASEIISVCHYPDFARCRVSLLNIWVLLDICALLNIHEACS